MISMRAPKKLFKHEPISSAWGLQKPWQPCMQASLVPVFKCQEFAKAHVKLSLGAACKLGKFYLTSELRALPCHHLDSKMLVPTTRSLLLCVCMPQTVSGLCAQDALHWVENFCWVILALLLGARGALGGGGRLGGGLVGVEISSFRRVCSVSLSRQRLRQRCEARGVHENDDCFEAALRQRGRAT